jgi:MFS family permease
VHEHDRRSYRALFSIPDLPQVVVSMQLARVAQSMVSVALVLFTLAEYQSPELTGLVMFFILFPGILVSPLAGALLDRHGRVRLIRLDYVVALGTMLAIGGLSMLGLLTPVLLIIIATIASITGPFSQTGLRSLFPMMVPEQLWERINAFDSNGYVLASIFGPPLAAGLVAIAGPQVAVMTIAVPYGLAAVVLLGVKDPPSPVATTGRLLRDAIDGVRYVWGNQTLRGLGFSISTLNLAGGIGTIVIPLLVLERLGGNELLVGVAFALSGISGMVSVFLFGRMDTRGKEWAMLAYPMALSVPVTALLLIADADPIVAMMPAVGLLFVGASMFLIGLLWGPLDIAMFTIRQRRTDRAWLGRGISVSMAFNFAGFPVGAALAGVLAAMSVDLAIIAAILFSALATVFAAVMVPRDAPAVGSLDDSQPAVGL